MDKKITGLSSSPAPLTDETTQSGAKKVSTKKIGIIGAMDEEVDMLKNSLTDMKVTTVAGMDFCEGKLDGTDSVVVKCNMGKVNAGVCAQLLISRFEVGCVINTGVAGSLDAKIDIGDIVVSTEAVQHDYDLVPIGGKPGELLDYGIVAFKADDDMRRYAVEAVRETAPEVKAFEGRICSGDQFIASKEQKARIVDTFGGLCCEMEGAAIAQVCYMNSTPFVIIRAISDKADNSEEMSFEVFKKDTAERCAGIAKYIAAHE